jgi:hypothetical protein
MKIKGTEKKMAQKFKETSSMLKDAMLLQASALGLTL